MKRLLVTLIAMLSLAACGKKGALIPPEAMAPAPIGDLQTAQRGEAFYISWSAPTRDDAGRALPDLAGFMIYRREVLPPAEDCEECPTAYHLIKSVDAEYLQDTYRSDSRFFFIGADLKDNTTYQFKAISVKKDGIESGPSNRARRKKVAPPDATTLKAASTPTSILLEWQPVTAPDNGKVEGYHIYRKQRGETNFPLQPLTGTPLSAVRYEDLGQERGVTYLYGVRTVARINGELVESALSNEAEGALTQPE